MDFKVSLPNYSNPLEMLRYLRGYYVCPKDSNGKRLGPLVGYAGTYLADDGSKKQFVGDVYVNFAKAEEEIYFLLSIAISLSKKMNFLLADIDAYCGAPFGGYSIASMLGLASNRRVIKSEKKVTAIATPNEREKSELVFGRHSVNLNEGIAIAEDVCNNFSTTEKHIGLIKKNGGDVRAIICFLNRSLQYDDGYVYPPTGEEIPIIALVRQPFPEYRQDDPEVADDIARGNVIWKPKDRWDELEKAMVVIG